MGSSIRIQNRNCCKNRVQCPQNSQDGVHYIFSRLKYAVNKRFSNAMFFVFSSIAPLYDYLKKILKKMTDLRLEKVEIFLEELPPPDFENNCSRIFLILQRSAKREQSRFLKIICVLEEFLNMTYFRMPQLPSKTSREKQSKKKKFLSFVALRLRFHYSFH